MGPLRLTISAAAVLFTCSPALAQTDIEDEDNAPKVTPYLKCERLSWVENCKEIAERAAENPGAPVRLTTPNGLEMYFTPGTPTAVIEHQLNPTPASATRLLEYHRAYLAQIEKATGLVQQAMLEDGSLLGNRMGIGVAEYAGLLPEALLPEPRVEDSEIRHPIDYSKFRLVVLLESVDPVCRRLLPELNALARIHPKLDMGIFQIDDNRNFIKQVSQYPHIGIAMPSAEDRLNLRTRINKTPTFWVQMKGSKKTIVFEGWHSASTLAQELSVLSRGNGR